MVLIKSSVKRVALPLAVGSMMMLNGCKSDEPEVQLSQTDLLVGDWKLIELDGYDYTDYSILFKFNSSGDWQWCYDDGSNTEYCRDGSWKWENSETRIGIDFQDAQWTIDVVVLDQTRLEGTFSYYDGGDTNNVKFVKVQ